MKRRKNRKRLGTIKRMECTLEAIKLLNPNWKIASCREQ